MLYTQITSLRSWQPTPMHGVTLIELMMVLIITAVVLSMAAPTLNETIIRSRITSNTNEVLSYLNYARNEAITRGRQVTMCKSANGTVCATNAFGWEQGFIIFVNVPNIPGPDPDSSQVDDNNIILRVHDKLEGNVTLQGNTFVENSIVYSSNGRVDGIQNGTLSMCDNSGNGLKNAIVISNMGRARSDRNCKACPSPNSPCPDCKATCPQ